MEHEFLVTKEDYLMTLKEFTESVKNGLFIDYDGQGYYSNGDYYFTNLPVNPSDINDNNINDHFKFVVWFNK